jgi:hypothetical protein
MKQEKKINSNEIIQFLIKNVQFEKEKRKKKKKSKNVQK